MNRKHIIIPGIILSIAALFILFSTTIYSPTLLPSVPLTAYQDIQHLEIADTPEKTATGLMWRRDLCDGCGMLFIFIPPSIIHMWMKNTPTSLDMIFMDNEGKIVGIFKQTIPFQEYPLYTVSTKVMYVLEMKAGFVEKQNLETDMQFDMAKLKEIASQSIGTVK